MVPRAVLMAKRRGVPREKCERVGKAKKEKKMRENGPSEECGRG